MALALARSMERLAAIAAARQLNAKVSSFGILTLSFYHFLTLSDIGDGTKDRFQEPLEQSIGGGQKVYRYYCLPCIVDAKASKKRLSNLKNRQSQYGKLSFAAGIEKFQAEYEELGQWCRK